MCFDKRRIVDESVGVLLGRQQPVHLILCHPLIQGGQHVTQLSAHDSAIALLVKDPQALDKVLKVTLVLGVGNVLQDGQEVLKVHQLVAHVLLPRLAKHLQDVGVSHNTLPHWANVIFIAPVGVRLNKVRASLNSSIRSALYLRGMLLGSKSGSFGPRPRVRGLAWAWQQVLPPWWALPFWAQFS